MSHAPTIVVIAEVAKWQSTFLVVGLTLIVAGVVIVNTLSHTTVH
jgi:hypothetical protein